MHALFPYLAYILLLKITWNNIALVYRRYRPKEYETDWDNIDFDHPKDVKLINNKLKKLIAQDEDFEQVFGMEALTRWPPRKMYETIN